MRQKGVFEFLEAASFVKASYPEAKFIVVGGYQQGSPFGLTPEELHPVMANGIVEYLGYVSNIVEVITQSSVFVLPSYREGFPRSTQEAMAIGRPVITTDVAGCRDTVEDGVNGFLVPPWDAMALAEKMAYFINNPNQIERMGIESRKIAEKNYDANVVNVRLLNFANSTNKCNRWVNT